MKQLMIAAALALLTTTATAFTIDSVTENKFSAPVDPPRKMVAALQLQATIGLFSVGDNEMVEVAPGTMMIIVKYAKPDPDNNVCVLLPEAVTKGLRAHSPSGCFWVYLKGAGK